MNLPEGTVTFLFSDVEGSTQLLEQHPHEMGTALARHHELFEAAVAAANGVIFETVGDAVYAAFSSPSAAVRAALEAQLSLAAEDWGVIERIACRISLHTGEVERRGDHYFGSALFRCARLQAIGYGEQTLLSAVTAEAARDDLPNGAGLRDMGQHRLKDLGQPEHVFMLLHPKLRNTFPPPKSVDLRPNNLPLQLSSFVGRTGETDKVASLATQHRLVTLTGPGGVGKTRLALQVAGQLISDLPDGAFLIDLAAARRADELPAVAATALGLTLTPDQSPASTLAEYLASRQLVLVMDNVEQIRDAAVPVLDLLGRAPKLRLLVTSRTPLHVRGEQVHEVEPLPVEGSDATPSAAVDLFLQRAGAAGQFQVTDAVMSTVAEICRRLDGMPLAIELAAARTTIFEPDELLTRLDHALGLLTAGARDLPERQRTLRTAIGWSYDLLEPEEQTAFARLAVFRGSWTLAAAEAVAGLDADMLERLHDAGLVRRDGRRFRLLETIREFAAERLAESAEAEDTGHRHARWYADWVESMGAPEAFKHLMYPAEIAALNAERENLVAATERLLAEGDGRRMRRLALRLWNYWMSFGYMDRGEAWVMKSLELPPDVPGPEAAWLTEVAGEFVRFGGEPQRAITIKERALALARSLGEVRTEAAVLHDMAGCWVAIGDLAKARPLAEEALAIRRRIGLGPGIAHAINALADIELRAGNYERARELFSEGIGYVDELDTTQVLIGLADVDRALGNTQEAAATMVRAIELGLRWDHAMVSCDLLEATSALLADCDRCRTAALTVGARERLKQESGIVIYYTDSYASTLERIRSSMSESEMNDAVQEGRRMFTRDALQVALDSCRELMT